MMQCLEVAAMAICDVVVFREPTLSEMLADPVIQAVMKADRVDPAEVWALMERMQRGAGR